MTDSRQVRKLPRNHRIELRNEGPEGRRRELQLVFFSPKRSPGATVTTDLDGGQGCLWRCHGTLCGLLNERSDGLGL